MNPHVVGYNSVQNTYKIDKKNLMKYFMPQDLKSFGLIPEIIGRLPILTYLNPLDKSALRRILTEPKNSIIKQYIKIMEMDNIKMEIDDEVYDFIVSKALDYKLGARGLRSIVEGILREALFELPSSKKRTFHLTLDYAKEHLRENFSLL